MDRGTHISAIREAEARVAKPDIWGRVELGVRRLNLSAWCIQHGHHQDALDAVVGACEEFYAWSMAFGGKPFGWVDLRHAAAWYNAAVVFSTGHEQDAEVAEMLDNAGVWLARVEGEDRSSPSYAAVTSAIAYMRAP